MNYKRLFIPNTFLHIIIVTYNRDNILIDNINLLRTAFKNTMKNYKFEIFSICVLPNHIHLIIQPENINEYPKIISSIKHYFSKNINTNNTNRIVKSGYMNKREKGIFQRRFYEHTIKSEEELYKHVEYIHYNPVKHGYVESVKDWEYSSFHKFVKNNYYDVHWGSKLDIKNIENMDFE